METYQSIREAGLAGLKEAAAKYRADSHPREYGGLILKRNGEYIVTDIVKGDDHSISLNPFEIGVNVNEVIGTFHVHPAGEVSKYFSENDMWAGVMTGMQNWYMADMSDGTVYEADGDLDPVFVPIVGRFGALGRVVGSV